MPTYVVLGFVFFISLFLGSFYNVVALRMMLGNQSIVYPPSHCVSCKNKLKFFDLIPVLSYLFLKGKCRYCHEKISPIYPFGEILTAISYTLIVYKYGFTIETVIHLVFITMIIIATITDIKKTIVPDKIIVIGLVAVLVLRILSGDTDVFKYIISSIISFLLLLLILLLSNGKMGGADVKLYSLIGLSVGLNAAIGSLFYASIIALMYHIPKIIKKEQIKGVEFPFVPFITIGVLITYIYNAYSFFNI